ncbi:hypothetical protein RhiirA5_436908 [Rhizophagus irregularis]|uniref:Uncharacterized protein n=1 Tax=Rhizophagus irregularis TaxID=588596 RepID=A0A2N0NL83_9GLOM|nr:hypothetical protein RhiirA5_436908 [Rhizophagus irregularis]
MNQNTFQNNQNDPTFTEFSNLQSTVIQPGHSSNNNTMNVNPSNNNIFPTFHTNNNFPGQQLTSNENNASTSIVSSYPPQYYVGPQQPIENTSPINPFNMANINPSQSQILSFDIPGYKIIIIPTCSSLDITNTQFTQFQR